MGEGERESEWGRERGKVSEGGRACKGGRAEESMCIM